MEQESLLPMNHNGITDAAPANLLGCGAAFVTKLINLEDAAVPPPDKPGTDRAFLIDIKIDRDIRFPTLHLHLQTHSRLSTVG